MGQGYHSRSPEEFREFLSSIKKGSKRRTVGRLLVLVDILLLAIVLFLVSNYIRPGIGSTLDSNHIQFEGAELYLKKPAEKSDSIRFFFFFKNTSKSPLRFPPGPTEFRFKLMAENNLLCLEKTVPVSTRYLEPGEIQYELIQIDSQEENSLPDECKTLRKAYTDRGFFSRFTHESNLQAILWMRSLKEENRVLIPEL